MTTVTDEDIFAFEVSDEALEIAAGTENEKASYTLRGLQRPVCLPRLTSLSASRLDLERPPAGGLSVSNFDLKTPKDAFYAGRPARPPKCPFCAIVAQAARSTSIMKSRVIGTASRLVESSN